MSTDKNFSTADNNDPRPLTEESGISGNNTENARQEPKYTQLYGLEGADGKMSLDPQASPEFQGAKGKEEPHKRISKQFDIDPKTHKSLLIAHPFCLPTFYTFIYIVLYLQSPRVEHFA